MQLIDIEAKHQDVLWDLLHVALWDPPPAGLRPREVLQIPAVAAYAQDWGKTTDVGTMAVEDGQIMGACWSRLLDSGLGYVDAYTPQLGIALFPEFQRRGIGKQIMLRQLEKLAGRFPSVSLTVHPENGARQLYEQCGFAVHRVVDRGYLLMLKPL
jgi:ribosomal protein S18 acetylase RimI-like enzyme